MNKKMRQELEQFYRAPKPKRKREFLQKFGSHKISVGHMLYIQMRYIPKWIWGISVLFVLFVWYMERFLPDRMLGSILTIIPFLVMIFVTKSLRSITYGMQELELAAQFSLKSIILARMGILGIVNIILFTAFLCFLGENALRSILFLLVPYLITAIGNLILVRRIPEKENVYACMGFSVVVSGVQNLLQINYTFIYEAKYSIFWLLAFLVLCIITAAESKKTIWGIAEYL